MDSFVRKMVRDCGFQSKKSSPLTTVKFCVIFPVSAEEKKKVYWPELLTKSFIYQWIICITVLAPSMVLNLGDHKVTYKKLYRQILILLDGCCHRLAILLSLLGARITGMCHHAWFSWRFCVCMMLLCVWPWCLCGSQRFTFAICLCHSTSFKMGLFTLA